MNFFLTKYVIENCCVQVVVIDWTTMGADDSMLSGGIGQ